MRCPPGQWKPRRSTSRRCRTGMRGPVVIRRRLSMKKAPLPSLRPSLPSIPHSPCRAHTVLCRAIALTGQPYMCVVLRELRARIRCTLGRWAGAAEDVRAALRALERGAGGARHVQAPKETPTEVNSRAAKSGRDLVTKTYLIASPSSVEITTRYYFFALR